MFPLYVTKLLYSSDDNSSHQSFPLFRLEDVRFTEKHKGLLRHLRVQSKSSYAMIRELTNRRLLHDGAVRLLGMLNAHAFLSTCQLRAKVDDVGESNLPAS